MFHLIKIRLLVADMFPAERHMTKLIVPLCNFVIASQIEIKRQQILNY